MAFVQSAAFNLLVFNVTWLLCVVGRENWLWLSTSLLLGYTALLLYSRRVSATVLLPTVLIGCSVDAVLQFFGLMAFTTPHLFPIWLSLLWLNFAIAMNLSLRWLEQCFWCAAIGGSIAFPLNYAVGERLGAVAFTAPYPLVLGTLAALWAFGLPLLYQVRRGLSEEFTAQRIAIHKRG